MSLRPDLKSKFTAEAERFLHEVETSPSEFVEFLEDFAKDLANAVNRVIRGHSLVPFVIGTGGDFQEFAAPFIRYLDRPYGYGVGCLWPYESKGNHKGIKPIYFNQEYLEKAPINQNLLILAQSLINDRSPIEAVVERALELKPNMDILIVTGASTSAAVTRVRRTFRNRSTIVSAASMPDTSVALADLNYWTLASHLDRREFKYMPKFPTQLLGRLDASYDERLQDEWRLPPERKLEF